MDSNPRPAPYRGAALPTELTEPNEQTAATPNSDAAGLFIDVHNVKQQDPEGSKSNHARERLRPAQAQARKLVRQRGAGIQGTPQRAHDARVDAKPGFAREFRGFCSPPACRRRVFCPPPG